MQTFSVKPTHEIPVLLFVSLLLSAFNWNCSLISLHRDTSDHWNVSTAKERSRQLEKLNILSGSGQIGFDIAPGKGTVFFDFEYRTADTLNIKVQDPLGRQLANLELCGDTYHLWLSRQGEYFSGTEIETDQTPVPIGRISPSVIRQVLLAGPLQSGEFGKDISAGQSLDNSAVVRYKFKAGQDEPIELEWQYKDRQLMVIYKQYVDVADLRIPSQIIISDKSENLSIIIHFSHFNSGMLKFQM